MADELCLAVKGDFDFTIKVDTQNESMQKLTMLVNFVLDTARRSLLEVRQKNARLLELDQLKSDFISTISHELRTPLTLILGPLKTILANNADELPQHVEENLERMQRNAARLYILVNNILDFSKLEAGKFTRHEEPLDLNALVSQLVNDTQDLACEHKIKLQFKPAKKLKNILLDGEKLEKIIFNLLSNALKFTPAEGTVTVELTELPNTISLRVSDTGPGIPEEQLPLIFQRFHQVDSSTTRAYEGTGIGLTVVKQFLDLMQGEISVKSELNKGTSFTVSLPKRFASTPFAKNKTPNTPSSSREYFKKGLSLNHRKKIPPKQPTQEVCLPRLVVVDDNIDMQAYIISLLKDKFEVITAENGKLALAAIEQYKPHVIISDIMMPLIDGYELTKILKNRAETAHVPIILITAKAGDDAVVSSLEVGADDYLAKPFTPEELIARTTAAYKHYQDYLQTCELNSQLLSIARRAGMADLATSILHNIGNVLNSVNVSLDMIKENTNQPYIHDLTTVSTILKDHQANLAHFLTEDIKGKMVPDYLMALIRKINHHYENITKEVRCLREQINHIADVVAMQETMSGISGVVEKILLSEAIETAITMCKASLDKKDINVRLEIKDPVFITTDKAKLLQILINLIQNANDALSGQQATSKDKWIRFIVEEQPLNQGVTITVQDNGIGIKEEHRDQIFSFGFTTKPFGHGFGLHASALAAKELGGSLQMKSQGRGYGAEFILTLPLKQAKRRYVNESSYEKRENPHY